MLFYSPHTLFTLKILDRQLLFPKIVTSIPYVRLEKSTICIFPVCKYFFSSVAIKYIKMRVRVTP